jgi:hypothetical protein
MTEEAKTPDAAPEPDVAPAEPTPEPEPKPRVVKPRKAADVPEGRYFGDFVPEDHPAFKSTPKKGASSAIMPDFIPATFDCPSCDFKGKNEAALKSHTQQKHK